MAVAVFTEDMTVVYEGSLYSISEVVERFGNGKTVEQVIARLSNSDLSIEQILEETPAPVEKVTIIPPKEVEPKRTTDDDIVKGVISNIKKARKKQIVQVVDEQDEAGLPGFYRPAILQTITASGTMVHLMWFEAQGCRDYIVGFLEKDPDVMEKAGKYAAQILGKQTAGASLLKDDDERSSVKRLFELRKAKLQSFY